MLDAPDAAPMTLFAAQALLPEGWRANVRISMRGAVFTSVAPDSVAEAGDIGVDIALPPLPSLHSHAFQRAMAGRAETRRDPADSFWTWRTAMYALAHAMTPEAMRAIATYLYMEMLKSGYAQVGEFHYLHRAPDGSAYDEPASMALALAEAASNAGIGLTMLPTLYAQAGFGRPLAPEQRRFASDPDFIMRVIEAVQRHHRDDPLVSTGIALHSLRAVSGADMRAMLDMAPADAPIHIHAAEQMREVEDCVAHLGRRPVAWLLDEYPVDRRWCIVHATHLDDDECARLARSGAVAGLCPITEANLGDGIFPLGAYLDAGGALGIGSDSNILLNPAEELRTLEYGQRLLTRTRARALPTGQTGSIGASLHARALAGGAQACGLDRAGGALGLRSGARADLCALDADRLALPGLAGDDILDAAIFAGTSLPVDAMICAGRMVVQGGAHRDEAAITARFRRAMAALTSDMS